MMVEFEMYSADFLRDYLGFKDIDIRRVPFYLFVSKHTGRLVGNDIVCSTNDKQCKFDSKMCRIIKIVEE